MVTNLNEQLVQQSLASADLSDSWCLVFQLLTTFRKLAAAYNHTLDRYIVAKKSVIFDLMCVLRADILKDCL